MFTALLTSPTIWKLIIRHVVSGLGVYLESKGIVSGTQWEELLGLPAMLIPVLHSIYDKRAIIKADVDAIIAKSLTK
jgi:hypothetical protein